MKNIKTIIPLLLLFVSSFAFAQIVNIPDANFKAKLLQADVTNTIAKDLSGNWFEIDANNDGEIQESEALQVSYLDLIPFNFDQTLQIADMQGIESFINLIYLDSTYNSFTSLDTSNNTNLEVLKSRISLNLTSINVSNNLILDSLDVTGSQLASLNLNNNISLKSLKVRSNALNSLDVSNNVNLELIDCSENQITTLDFSNNNSLESIIANSNQLSNLNINNTTNLISLICNGNSLTSLNVSDSVNLSNINCNQNQITNLDFTNNTNLESLNCFGNQLTSLNVSSCANLNYLLCSYNQLISLDVSNNDNLVNLNANNNMLMSLDLANNLNLENLYVSSNQLTTLSFGNNSNLLFIDCSFNQLNSLDVTTLTSLTQLRCALNQIANIDLSNNNLLEEININGNQLTSIDLSNNSFLNDLNCSYNLLTSLDVSANLDLYSIQCDGNQLINLDFSSNPNLNAFSFVDNIDLIYVNIKNGIHFVEEFQIYNLPSLEFVCVDEDEYLAFQNILVTNGITANVNSYCSFNPGGDYNTITGNITFDSQNNGCDANDVAFPFIKININDGVETGSTFTTNAGEYNFYTQDGTFTVIPDLENSTFFNVTPLDATINFPDTNNNIAIQDFCITANGVHQDVEIVMAPNIPARPGFDAVYLITYKNKGNQTLSGDFSFAFDDSVLDFLSATETPTTQNTGLLTWDYVDLLPFESRSVYVTLNVNGPTETPAVNIDDELDFNVIINPVAGDESPNDNQMDYNQIVVGAFDPNDITCIEGDFVEPTEIGEYLHYIINFENTGNADAQNIVVKTEIDPTMFDINSLRVLSSSHDAYVKVREGKVEIVFESIYLSSGGHGNILLKVQSQDDLQTDDTVTKNAEIFFDYNFPIETNDANTTYSTLSTSEFEIDQEVSIYPNPVKSIVTISAKDNIKSVALFDVQGRVLQTKLNSSQEVKLDLTERASGFYFLKIITNKGIKVEKILKD
nr:T9SS type A sorting domain-containing protein [uncultured Psychroserpens sp.]